MLINLQTQVINKTRLRLLAFLLTALLTLPLTQSTRAWPAAESMTTARYGHTATLLPDGRVLVVGGYNANSLTSAELYNPALNSWSAAENLTVARNYHTATLLPNGRVLVAGG